MSEPTQNPPPAAEGGDAAPAGPSKSELKKRAKEAEKAKKAAERQAKEEEERQKREAAASVDNASQNYGKQPLHQSQERTGRERLKFPTLSKESVGKEVIFRARLHNMRPQGEPSLPSVAAGAREREVRTDRTRCQDCLLAVPTADADATGCPGGFRRKG